MNQPQANQFMLNGFKNNPAGNLERFLPKKLKKFNKLSTLWVANLACLSPVHKIFTSLNIVFILVILTLFVFGIRTWTHPQYLDNMDESNLEVTSPTLAPLVVTRQNLSPKIVNEVTNNNLFRKERDEYTPPAQPSNIQVTKMPQKPMIPPPQLALSGIMLLNDTKIAILGGSLSVSKGNEIEKKDIKRKGYYLGDQIGDYKIVQIKKRKVVLNNPSGQILTVNLIRRLPSMDKSQKNKRKPKIISTRPQVKQKAQSAFRISGALTPPTPKHISGN